jgi:hypothetical protein
MNWMKIGHIGIFILLILTAGNSLLYAGTPPTANFNVDNAAPVTGQTITFTDASVNNTGNINSWSWNFGTDAVPATANTQGPHNVYYTSPGSKTASLTVAWPAVGGLFGISAGSNTINSTVNVTCNNPTSTISPKPASVVYGSNLTLNGNPSGGSGTYTTHTWTGAGAIYLNATNTPNPIFSGAPAGNYNLTYTVTDSYGCVGTDNLTITVTKKALTFTAGNQTVPYGTHAGTVTKNGSYTISGYVNGDNSSVVNGLGSVSYSTTYTATTNAGTSGITITPVLTGLSSANYSLIAANGSITISKADQYITCDCVPFTKPLNEFTTIPIGATSSSGLPVTITMLAGSAATLNGSPGNYYLTDIGITGTVTLYANQPGNVNYNAATQSTRFFDVTKSNQNISFPNINDINYYNGLSISLEATATSGLAVSYTVLSGPATVSGNTLSITGAGEVRVMAGQAGNASFNAAPSIVKTFNVLKGAQTITIAVQAGALTTSTQITGTSTSGLPVTLSLGAGSAATGLVYNSGGGYYTLTGIGGSGNIYIAGNQAGDANFEQAPQLLHTIVIGKTNQTINFPAIGNKTFGDSPFGLGATATSGLPVTYTVTGPATLSGSTLTITGAGTVTILASQPGNGTFNPAPDVTQQFEVEKAIGVITQAAITATFGDAAFPINPSSNSSGNLSFLSGNDNIFTITGNTATIVGAGTTTLDITLQPTSNYFGAIKTVPFVVNKASSTISMTGAVSFVYNNQHQGPDGSTVTGSTGPVTYSYSGAGTTSYGPSATKPVDAGTYSATATVAADDNYNSATSAPYNFTILKADPTISVTPYSVTYDGTPNTSAGTAVGISSENLAGLDLSNTTHTSAGTYSDNWTFTDVTGNYNDASGTVNNTIDPAMLSITANDATKCFGDVFSFVGTEFTSSGLIGIETIGAVALSSPGAAAGAAAGNYSIAPSNATGGTFDPANYSITYIDGDLLVNPQPSLTGATQASSVCDGSQATINLSGLLANSTFSLQYTINNVAQTPITGLTANASGASSFSTPALTNANNGQVLQITGITLTSVTPVCSRSFAQNVTLVVTPLPTLTGASQSSVVCNGSAATINLTGLTPGSTYAVGYTINGGPNLNATGLVVDGLGNSSFTTGNLTSANNGQTLNIYGIQNENTTCARSYNYDVTLQIDPNSVAGTPSANQTICHGTSPSNITLTGSTGAIQWEVSTDNVNFSPISGATLSTLSSAQMGTLTATTYYRAQVISGVCAPVNSAVVTVSARPQFTAGEIETTGESICYNSNPGLIGSASPANGGDNNITYQWQSSTDAAFTSPVTIASNTATYDPPVNLTVSTWYRRQAKDNTCNSTFTNSSGVWAVSIYLSPVYVTATSGTLSACYPSVKAAFDKINDGTHKGAIVVQINSNTTETATAVLNSSGTGNSSYTSVNMYPTAAGIEVSGSINGRIIDLDGADNVTIDGRINGSGASKSLSIINTNTGTSVSTIRFINSAENNVIRDCVISSSSGATTAGGTIFFSTATAGNGNSGNTVTNCGITTANATADNRPMNSIYSSGSAGFENKNNTIVNNHFYDFFRSTAHSFGINILSNSQDWHISTNSFYETSTFTATGNFIYRPIYLGGNSVVGFNINENYIGGTASNNGGSPWTIASGGSTQIIGIDIAAVGNTVATTVQKNIIRNIDLSTLNVSSAVAFRGIYTSAGKVDILNNTIGSSTGNGSIIIRATAASGVTLVNGIQSASGSEVNIQNNTIGSIDMEGGASNGFTFNGISTSGPGANYMVSNNLIGSTTTPNSIKIGTNGVTTTGVCTFYGISTANTGTATVIGNTIQNCTTYGTAASTLQAINNTGAAIFASISNNNIFNFTNTGTGMLRGISNTAAAANLSINSNTIGNHTITSALGTFTGITSTGAVPISLEINNNQLGVPGGNLVNYQVANSGALLGINASATAATCSVSIKTNDIRGISNTVTATHAHTYISNTSVAASHDVSDNTFTNLNVNTTGSVTFIANSAAMPTNATQLVKNNKIITSFNKGAAGGTVTCITSTAATVSAGVNVFVEDNDFSNITVTGSTAVNGIVNTDGGTGNPTKTIKNNTLTNWTGGTGVMQGISVSGTGSGGSITLNTISNFSNRTTISGIVAGAGNDNIYSNQINGLNAIQTGSTSVTGISVASGTTKNVYQNTIYDLSTGTGINTGSVRGIAITGGTGTVANVYQNTIYGLTASSFTTGTISGIQVAGATASNVYQNKIYDLTYTGNSFSTGTVNGLYVSALGAAGESNIHNNLVGHIAAPNVNSATDFVRGINVAATTVSTKINLYYNTVYLNTTSSGANFSSTGVYHAASNNSTTAALEMKNNLIVNLSTAKGSGFTVAYRRSSGTANRLNNYSASSDNNSFYAGTPGAANLVFYDGTTGGRAQTIDEYKSGSYTAGTIAPRDQASVSVNPVFLSTTGTDGNFLHVSNANCELDGNGVPISGITIDYDNEARDAVTPDIGADEFVSVISNPVITVQPVSPSPECFGSIVGNIGVTASGGLAPLSYQWFSNTVNNNTTGTIIPGATSSIFTPPSDVPGTVYYYVEIKSNGTGCGSAISSTATVVLNPLPATGEIIPD